MENHTTENSREIASFINRTGVHRKLSAVLSYLVKKKGVTLRLLMEGGSYTDGQNVTVGVSPEFHSLSTEQLYVMLTALLGHEAQHVLSSNFRKFKKYLEEQSERLVKEGFSKDFATRTAHSIANILEDGRIERILGRNMPGFVKKLQFLNLFYWERGAMTGEEDPISGVMNTMLTHAKLGIYPKNYKEYGAGTEVDVQFEGIKDLIPKAIVARTHGENLEVCVEVIDRLLPFLKEQYEEIKEQEEMMQALMEALQELVESSNFRNSEESQKNDGPRGQGSPIHMPSLSPSGEEGEEGGEGSAGSEEGEPVEGDAGKGRSSAEGMKEPGQDEASGSSSEKKEGEGSEEEGADSKDSESKKKSKSKGKARSENPSGSNNASSGREESRSDETRINPEDAIAALLARLQQEAAEEGARGIEDAVRIEQAERKREAGVEVEPNTRFNDPIRELGTDFQEVPVEGEPGQEIPPVVRVAAKKFKRDVEKIMKSRAQLNVNGQPKGILAEEDLHRIAIKDYSVFTVEGHKSLSDHVFYILQDGSGSMMGEKEENSAYALSVIEEGLKGLVPFKVTTFSAGYGRVVHFVVKPWTGKSKKSYSFSYFKRTRAGGGNEDDVSIRVATKELMARSERDKVLIVLSDGLPSSQEKTKAAIKAARKQGIHVVGIMFGDEDFRKSHYEEYRSMYEKNIISSSVHGIPGKLAETLKRILSR